MTMSSPRWALAMAGLTLLLASLIASPAQAAPAPSHPFLFELPEHAPAPPPFPPPEGELEDACGVAVDLFGDIYVSDYYHRTIDVYGPGPHPAYLTQIADPGPDGPCNLAVDPEGRLYVNHWRRDVIRYTPSEFPLTDSTTYGQPTTIDFPSSPGARSTGVFLDPASGDLYVDDRTYIAVYEAASLSQPEPEPVRTIGLGTLGQAYGVAVSDFGETAGRVYVADATTNTVKVFGPAGEALAPIDGAGTPQQGFVSLADSALAIDQKDGHLFVADNLEAGFEAPAAAIDEFNSRGDYRGQLPHLFIDAEPSALAVDGHGNVYATSGNTEGAELFGFGPTEPAHLLEVGESGEGEGAVISEPAGINCGTACAAEFNAGEEVTLTAVPDPGSAFVGWSGCEHPAGPRCTLTMGADKSVGAEFEPAPAAALLRIGAAAATTATLPPAAIASSPGPLARHPRTVGRRHRHHRKGRSLRVKGGRH